MLLAEYNCKVEYHKGKLNIRADMLSRIKMTDSINTFDTSYWQLGDPLPDLPPDLTPADIYSLDLKTLARQQRGMTEWTEHNNEDSHFELINGLLYSTLLPHKYAADYPRLVLPQQQRQVVMARAHKDVGHMSTYKTMRHIQQAFVWPHMRQQIEQFIALCPICIAHSKVNPKAPMGDMPIAQSPLQIVAMDLIGPLIRSTDGHLYILTIIDHCTGWAEAYPLKNKTSAEVWQRLSRQFFPRHGYPDVMISDRGLEFGATALRQYLKDLGIEHRRTTPYNPQANGKCERFNGTLKQIISRLANNTRSDWEDQLGPALMAYNNSVSVATGHTPYFLLYGRRARLPISRLLPEDDRMDDRLHKVAAALRTAAQVTKASRLHNRQRLDRQANTGTYAAGDSVVIKAQEPLSLTSRWDPQWTVTRVRGKVLDLVHQQTGNTKVLNVNKVRLVDPNIAWDQLNPRPKRNQTSSARQPPHREPIPLPQPAPPQATPKATKPTATADRAQQTMTKSHTPPGGARAVAPPRTTKQGQSKSTKRRRDDSLDHDGPLAPRNTHAHQPASGPPKAATALESSHLNPGPASAPAVTIPAPRPSTPPVALPSAPDITAPAPRPSTPPVVLPSAHTFTVPAQPPDASPRQVTARTAATSRPSQHRPGCAKKLHRQAPKHNLPPEFQPSLKRARPFLPRGVKRVLNIPSPGQQKKARVAVINTLIALLQA